MVALVADGSRKKLISCEGENIAVPVGSLNGYVSGTLADTVIAREGEAALNLLLLSGEGNDLGIDHFNYLALLYLDNYNAAKNANLHCRKSASARLSHRFGHIVKKGEYSGGDLLNGSRCLTKEGIAEFNYFKYCHFIRSFT